MEPRQKVMAILIGVTLITLSVQVVTASTSTDCPECKVVYDDVMTVNSGTSAPQEATHTGPLSLLDPSTAFTSPNQVSIADAVLKLI